MINLKQVILFEVVSFAYFCGAAISHEDYVFAAIIFIPMIFGYFYLLNRLADFSGSTSK